MKCVWYPCFRFSKYGWENRLANILLHFIPALLMDIFNKDEVRLTNVARKIESLTNVLNYFLGKEFYFGNKNMVEVQNR